MSKVGVAVNRTFQSLQTRNFRLFFVGQLVSTVGTWMNFTASAWLVLRITHDGVALGLNAALLFLPILFVGPFGGALADRHDKRKILICTQTAFAIVALSLWMLVATDVVQLWMVYALSLTAGFVTALDNPTRQSFYMEMVGEEHVSNAVSLNSAAFMASRIVGPAIAGVLIGSVGLAFAFLIDGLSYLAVIGALLAMRPGEMQAIPKSEPSDGGVKEGFRYVWNTPELRRPLILMAVVFTFAFNFQVLVPLLAEQTFNASAVAFGALSAVSGVGSLIGAIVLANRSSKDPGVPKLRRLALAALLSGAALIGAGLAPSLGTAAMAMIPLGLGAIMFIITGNTMLQLGSRPEFRGRVMAIFGMVFFGSTPFGSIIAGWMGEQWGARWALAFAGGTAIVAAIAALWWRSRALQASRAEVIETPQSRPQAATG